MEIINQNKNRRKSSLDLSTIVYGKVPPQARDLEEAVLGAIMLEKNAFDTASGILQSESFYLDAHRTIFESFKSLSKKNSPIDILTTVQELKSMEKLDDIGGPYYITKLTNSVVSAANIEAHCRILAQKFIQRELIRISGEIIGEAYEDTTDVFDLMDDAERRISDVTLSVTKKAYRRMDVVMEAALNKVEHLRNHPGTISGVSTGIFMLNQITRGWQATDFIVIAARPSIGKTAVALNLARSAATHDERPVNVGVFSLEMSDIQLVMRLLSAESEIAKDDLNRGRIDNRQMDVLYNVSKKDWTQRIFIDDTPALNIQEFKSKARKMVLQDKVKLIIVDYLQLMSSTGPKGQNREQEISTISRNCKALAKELNIPVIALSQLSRAIESRHGNKQPVLSDLRESGAIEQDTDIVIFLVPAEENEVSHDASLKDSLYIKIAKHRDGALDFMEVKFVKEIQKIMNRQDYESYIIRSGLGNGFKPVERSINFTESNRPDDYSPF